jgi:hypothetical protein
MTTPWRGVGTHTVLLATLLAMGGCARHAEEEEDTAPETAANAELAIEIENHNWSDVVISLVRGTSVERLGLVGSLKTETFVFPFRRLGSGEARPPPPPPRGPAGFTSENLYVQPGQMVKWTLESDLTRSFLAIY